VTDIRVAIAAAFGPARQETPHPIEICLLSGLHPRELGNVSRAASEGTPQDSLDYAGPKCPLNAEVAFPE